MNYNEWYEGLPPKLRGYVRTFEAYPTDSNKGFVTGYMQAANDYGYIGRGTLSFWFMLAIRVMEGLGPVEGARNEEAV